jgi:hypothetical protein
MTAGEKQASRRRATLGQRTARFWATDSNLTVLLLLLVANIFLVPAGQFATWGRLAGRVVLSLIIISGVIATVRSRPVILLASAVALGSLFLGWEDAARPNLYLHLFNNLDAFVFLGFFVVLILWQVLRAGPITPRRIQGAVAVYLLLGLLWAVLYEIVELLHPGSFSISAHRNADLPQLGYFSFTTLTTLGFGDILPLSPIARSLVVLEALVGQLFPVILIARLVAMEIEYQRTRQH